MIRSGGVEGSWKKTSGGVESRWLVQRIVRLELPAKPTNNPPSVEIGVGSSA
jgi:hypothetical protein